MRQTELRQVKTISAGSLKEFDKLYNSTARELGDRVTDVKDIDATTARFYYTVSESEPEDLGDAFMQAGVYAHCSDCPYCEIGTDARRKWFPCKFSAYGETRLDSNACEVFYKEALHRMREGGR